MNCTPEFRKDAFTCPHCGSYSKQTWHTLVSYDSGNIRVPHINSAQCHKCNNYTLWYNKKMVFPHTGRVESPANDLDDRVKYLYNEARRIVLGSPMSATSILRLAFKELCVQLGESGKDLTANVDSLLKRGLPDKIQKSLILARVIGKDRIEPGILDINDDINTAHTIFHSINIISELMIAKKRDIKFLYDIAQKKYIISESMDE